MEGLKGLERHNNRIGDTKYADKSRSHLNRILIGTEKMEEDVLMYLEGVKKRANSVIAREVILSGGNGFWDRMLPKDQEAWVQQNIKFLKDNFGDNCVHAILHLDETTPHIHAIIVPVFENDKGLPYLSNAKYFDGKEKLAGWQDKYTDCMQQKFNFFIRGIRGSKTKHIDLKVYHALVKENLEILSSESILAHAKENFINKKKVQELQETLKNDNEVKKLAKEIMKKNKELNEENKIFEYVMRELAVKYKIPEAEVIKIINNKEKEDNKNKYKQRER